MTEEQIIHLMEAAQTDELYQEMQALRSVYEPEYLRILSSLSEEDQYLLKMYIKTVEGLESRIARTAYFLTPKV